MTNPSIRRLLASLAAAAALTTLAACGDDSESAAADSPPASGPDAATTPEGENGTETDTGEQSPDTADADAVATSVARDVEAYAVQLEQVFFGQGYPKDLAGAVAVARQLDLSLSPGNSIAGYRYDPDAQEFRLCVENTSGAFAIYDTEPMSRIEAGNGGCALG